MYKHVVVSHQSFTTTTLSKILHQTRPLFCRNPINGVRELKPYVMPTRSIRPLSERALNRNDVAFWQQGLGKGGERPWKFKCSCKEECSSYENCRYHPTGRMYECSYCSVWCHVDCVLGPETTDDDIDEMEEVLCHACRSKFSRSRRYSGPVVVPPTYLTSCSRNDVTVIKIAEASPSLLENEAEVFTSYLTKRKEKVQEEKLKPAPKKQRRAIKAKVQPTEDQWVFKCSCREECSWYENKLYHPKGAIYSCSVCRTRGHVFCMLGENVTEEQAKSMKVTIIICVFLSLLLGLYFQILIIVGIAMLWLSIKGKSWTS